MKANILIIDDDAGIVEGLTTLLEDEGYQVSQASNGLEGLNFLSQHTHSIQLILLDLMMPVMDGYTFRERQRDLSSISQIPVIVLTAGSQNPQRLAEMDVTAIMKKPIDIDNLLDTIGGLI